MRYRLVVCVFVAGALNAATRSSSADEPRVSNRDPLLRVGDRVALLGGTFIERMQSCGALEAEVHCRRPTWRLSFRNLGWSGDDVHGIARKRFESPEDGFRRMIADIETAAPTVVLICYGSSEASDGPNSVARFDFGLRRLVRSVQSTGKRVILLEPVAMPGYRVEGYARLLRQCRKIVDKVGRERDVPVVSCDWRPRDSDLAEHRLVPNEVGYAKLAKIVAESLVGGQCHARSEPVRERILEKNELFFHRYRPQNETYLFLFRKREQGKHASEVEEFDPLIRRADQAIWKAAERGQ